MISDLKGWKHLTCHIMSQLSLSDPFTLWYKYYVLIYSHHTIKSYMIVLYCIIWFQYISIEFMMNQYVMSFHGGLESYAHGKCATSCGHLHDLLSRGGVLKVKASVLGVRDTRCRMRSSASPDLLAHDAHANTCTIDRAVIRRRNNNP